MQKRYRVNVPVAGAFAQKGVFRCKLGYATMVDGHRVVRSQANAPVIETLVMPEPSVVGTENDAAQTFIQFFQAPRNTYRNGEQRPEGSMFVDVTDVTTPADVTLDLDPIFEANEQSRS